MNGLNSPNQSGAIFGATQGIARDMQAASPSDASVRSVGSLGGGDLNGTASTTILLGHAGTPGSQIGVPRLGNPNMGIPNPAPFGWMLSGLWL